jgi:hypothetical protein
MGRVILILLALLLAAAVLQRWSILGSGNDAGALEARALVLVSSAEQGVDEAVSSRPYD